MRHDEGLRGSVGKSVLIHLPEAPFIFARQLRHNVVVPEIARQNFPRVGFNLEMRTERRLLRKRVEQVDVVSRG